MKSDEIKKLIHIVHNYLYLILQNYCLQNEFNFYCIKLFCSRHFFTVKPVQSSSMKKY